MPGNDIKKLSRNIFDSMLSENQKNSFSFVFNFADQQFFSSDKIFLKRDGSSTEVQDFFSIIILFIEKP